MIDPELNFTLSVIIPTLDEETVLPVLFASLSRQRGISFEVIISDASSSDGTCRAAANLATQFGIPLSLVSGNKGRGLQLNAGAALGRGEYLLFLHADCRFVDNLALKKGVDALADSGMKDVAAKFMLRFDRTATPASLAYSFYESKARLVRPECSHGDQALIMHRNTFIKYGPCDEFPQMLAETRLAERIRINGELRLISAEILTSTRRFETEGLYERQTLNAILMNCASQGWHEPFLAVSGLYRNQSKTGRLPLFRILETMKKLIKELPATERRCFWKATGHYVRTNAWQIAFLMDVRRNLKKGVAPGQGATPILEHFDRYLAPLLDNQAFNLLATALTWSWFNLTRLHSLIFRN